jgi:uncharacterized protein YndB with AHSA1/START domain
MNTTSPGSGSKHIAVTRVFKASIESVWKIWTDPELVKRWWGPARFICPSATINFKEGASSLVSMKAPAEMGGTEWFSIWRYRKIVPMKSIEFVQHLGDKDGNILEPVKAGMPADFPKEILTIVTFQELAGNEVEMTVTEYADFGQTTKFALMGLEQSMEKMLALFG